MFIITDNHGDKGEGKILIKMNRRSDLSIERNIIFTQTVSINCDMRRDKSKINNVDGCY